MKIKNYLIDNLYFIFLSLFFSFLIFLILCAFKTPPIAIFVILLILFSLFTSLLIINYTRRYKFYNELINNLDNLDQKYLILEMLHQPNFYDGELLYNILYDINKSMTEHVKEYELSINDFKEYIEMWIHEIKIPVASLTLLFHNHKDIYDKECAFEIKRVENYIEQVLYYVRSENAEKDYLLKENKLAKIISHVALRNKNDLLIKKVDFIVDVSQTQVLTDSKWLEFIINQIINNSLKYIDTNKKTHYIKIYVTQEKDTTILNIYDNGVGISKSDLKRVCEKSFTGENGHQTEAATGMGLYISDKLCQKLGHKLQIESQKDQYTLVKIIFGKNSYYDTLK